MLCWSAPEKILKWASIKMNKDNRDGEMSTDQSDTLFQASGSDLVGRALPITQVVLAGGSGTRLWPMSREKFPKQLIGILGTHSLLQTTVQRMRGFSGRRDIAPAPIVVCGIDHSHVTAEQMKASGVQARMIVEPVPRGTAPALTLAASFACSDTPDAIIVAMPADHVIDDVPAFQHAVELAALHAETGAIVTLGVPPTWADTGFGYIRLGPALDHGAHHIDGFVEKPGQEHAERYVESGAYWWNSGIFVMRASVWLETLKSLQPVMYQTCTDAFANGKHEPGFFRPATDAFEQAPHDSIDYAVMEQLGSNSALAPGVVVPLRAGWSDLGSWGAVWDALEKDSDGNVSRGQVLLEDVTSSYVHSEGRLIACVGVSNIVIVETEDAVLVVDRSRVQDVKGVVERIRALHRPEASAHRKVQRPWGYYDSIDQGDRFQVKRIVVQPGARLSLQLHHHRAEHWTVVRGTALVDRGDEHFFLGENESTYIPLGVTHRLHNPGKLPLEIIEVQSGSYLGEDDIVRFDDMYGRS
jgi:mannose-1-phosphate guanylyltransferase/mannose-6-phosphate isomerase